MAVPTEGPTMPYPYPIGDMVACMTDPILRFRAVDSHTEGMPTRVITDGVGVLPGETILERKLRFERECDGIRRLLMREPRGHQAMSGAILQPPCRPEADWGVV